MRSTCRTRIDGKCPAVGTALYANLAGDVVGYEPGVPNIPTLRAVTDHNDIDVVFVQSPAGWYHFIAASMAVDDGLNVVKPTDIGAGSPGRWHLLGAAAAAIPDDICRTIAFSVGTASISSASIIPANSMVRSTQVDVQTGYDNSATIEIGYDTDTDALMGTGENDPSVVNDYEKRSWKQWKSSDAVVKATVANAPTVGSAVVVVEYVKTPQL